ncbi:MAG: FAD-dependent oxidoreductase [Candidatus Methanospirareceae archaeon]
MKIGVYICHCGLEALGDEDIQGIRDFAAGLSNVEIAHSYMYMCSEQGQGLIKRDIEKMGIERVVIIAFCSTKVAEEVFKRTCEEAGLNKGYVEVINVGEEADAEKIKEMIARAVERAPDLRAVEEKEVEVIPAALVIGGGIAGMYAALNIADAGFKVYLVEKEPSIGGHMAQLDKTFPTLDCAACILTPRMVDVARHPNINLITYAEIENIDREKGNFKVKVRKKARYVDEAKCTGCGECARVCPVAILNEFDLCLSLRRAAYVPFPYAVPSVYTLERGKCMRCGLCKVVCEAGAINFEQKEEIIEIEVGAIIIATGFELFDPFKKPEYGYDLYDNVITGLEFERLCSASGPTRGKIEINGKEPKEVVFISCVGSRDKQVGNNYCSRVCCMYTAKQAHLLKEHLPDANITICYMDVRAFGKGFEEFYERVQREGITYRRGIPGEIYKRGDKLIVKGEDTLLGKPYEIEADLVVLATAIVPRKETEELLKMLKLSQSSDGFIAEEHQKIGPVDTAVDGVFLAGCCQSPKDIPDTVAQAKAAAAAAITTISGGKIKIESRRGEEN